MSYKPVTFPYVPSRETISLPKNNMDFDESCWEVMGPDRPVYDIEEWLAGYKISELYLARKQEAEELLVTTDDITCYNDFCVKALEEALEKGKPEIFNTDQGSQFTSEAFTGLLKQRGIQISMDGKGSYRDNLFVERLWRSVKYEEVYLKAYADGRDARAGIGEYLSFYNTQRPHQALGLSNPGGGIHIWKWRKRGNITDDINTGVYKGSPRS